MITQVRPIDRDEAFQTAFDGYLAGYPLVMLDAARRRHPGGANRFMHVRPGETIGLCSPNPHVVYSSAWLDLRSGPVVISLPDLRARHFVMPMIDAWGEIFSSLGVRRRGSGHQHLVVVGPTWSGCSTEDLPVVRAPTSAVWLLGRTLVDTLEDAEEGPWNDYFLTPKNVRGGVVTDPPGEEWAPWPATTQAPDGEDFLDRMAALMARHPPGAFRGDLGRRLARLGVCGTTSFKAADLPTEVAAGLNEGVAEAHASILSAAWPSATNGEQWTRLSRPGGGRLPPLERAAIIWRGFGFNLKEDAVYFTAARDAGGQALSGDRGYRLQFEPRRLPPVGACWSLTAYDLAGGLPAAVDGRIGLSSRDPLRFNADGSLDIRIQTHRPAGPAAANWLPTPASEFRLVLRAWWPGEAVLEGRWTPPLLRRSTTAEPKPFRKRLTDSVGVASGDADPRLGTAPDVGEGWMQAL